MKVPRRILLYGLVFMHIMLLACYTLPQQWIPGGMEKLAQLYVRPLFHQQWRLFAPDPPLCAAEVQVSADGTTWEALHAEPDHYLEQRIIRNIAFHVSHAVHADEGIHPVLKETLYRACGTAMDPAAMSYRLMEWCVLDPAKPQERTLRITPFAP